MISLDHLKRYREIAGLLWRHGRSDLVERMRSDDAFGLAEERVDGRNGSPERLADDLEAMGPTFVKIGQVLAGRPDLVPEPYVRALSRLQDRVKPFPYAQVERIVEDELGVRISKAFSRFDEKPLAAASLGQVHLAALRDGRPVVVKVQRPDVARRLAEDFEVLERVARFLDRHTDAGRRNRFGAVLDEFRTTIQQELDYELEASNLIVVGQNLEAFERIEVPSPVLDYCTRRVLTMDHVRGQKVSSLGPLARLETDGGPLVDQLLEAYLKQVLVDGIFHADPHAGNVFLTQDDRIALLDLGMVGHTGPGMQESLLKLLMAVSEGKGEQAAEEVLAIGEKLDDLEPNEFKRRVAQLVARRKDQSLVHIDVGASLLQVSRLARQHGLVVPSELTLLGKTLIQLDSIGRILDPEFDPNAAIRRHIGAILSQRMRQDVNQGSVLRSLIELKGFVANLPARLNRILDAITNAELEVTVTATDTKQVIAGLHKIANRITAGIVLAAMIVGASLLMRVQTRFLIFGYPGIAMLFFLAAAAGGVWLLVTIFLHDRRTRADAR